MPTKVPRWLYSPFINIKRLDPGRYGSNFKSISFQRIIHDNELGRSLWNCSQLRSTKLHLWKVNIGSANGLMAWLKVIQHCANDQFLFTIIFQAIVSNLCQPMQLKLKASKTMLWIFDIDKCTEWWPFVLPFLNVCWHGPLTRYVILWVVHASGMPGTFSPPSTSKETGS